MKNYSSLGKLQTSQEIESKKNDKKKSIIENLQEAVSSVVQRSPPKRTGAGFKSHQHSKSDTSILQRTAMTDSDYRPESGGALDEVSVHSATSHWKKTLIKVQAVPSPMKSKQWIDIEK